MVFDASDETPPAIVIMNRLCGVLMMGHATSGDGHVFAAAVLGQDRLAGPENAVKQAVLVLRRATGNAQIFICDQDVYVDVGWLCPRRLRHP